MFRCGNCGGAFTQTEASRLKPPMHPWPITASGQRTMLEFPQRGVLLSVCPGCGQPALFAR